jgi:hypothetical protein
MRDSATAREGVTSDEGEKHGVTAPLSDPCDRVTPDEGRRAFPLVGRTGGQSDGALSDQMPPCPGNRAFTALDAQPNGLAYRSFARHCWRAVAMRHTE